MPYHIKLQSKNKVIYSPVTYATNLEAIHYAIELVHELYGYHMSELVLRRVGMNLAICQQRKQIALIYLEKPSRVTI